MAKRAVGLVEVIVAVVILGMIAALAIPHLTRAAGSRSEGDVRGGLNVLRLAIELYYHDHGAYPGQRGDGRNEAGTAEAFVAQLTHFSDEHGAVASTKDALHRFGPYLRLGMPVCAVQPRAGATGVCMVKVAPSFQASATQAGWVYNPRTGDVAMNSNATDSDGVPYDEY